MSPRRHLPLAAAVLLALAVPGCGGGDDEADAGDGPSRIVIADDGYEPASLKVEVGERVAFVNRSQQSSHSAKDDSRGGVEVSPQPGATRHDGSEVNHATEDGFATHALFTGEKQTVVFDVPRKYSYYCAFHPNMKGTIEVVPKGG